MAFAEPIQAAELEATPQAAAELIENQVWPEVEREFRRLRANQGLIAAAVAALSAGAAGGTVAYRKSHKPSRRQAVVREAPPPQEVTTPSSTVTARIIPPPGWTCLASFGGTVGERSRHPSSSSSNIGSSRRGTGPSSTGASAGSRQSRLGSPDQ